MTTTTIPTSTLTGPALDWAVQTALGNTAVIKNGVCQVLVHTYFEHGNPVEVFERRSASQNWLLAGPIIDREGISIIRCYDDYGVDAKGFTTDERIPVWCATTGQHGVECTTQHQQHDDMYQVYASEVIYGPTSLIAAMRCYVASKLGASVEVPQELV